MKRRNFLTSAAALAVVPAAVASPPAIIGDHQWGVSVWNNSGHPSNFTAGITRVYLDHGQTFTGQMGTDAARHLLDTINVGRKPGIIIWMHRTKIEGTWKS